jgi:hypothetical protein
MLSDENISKNAFPLNVKNIQQKLCRAGLFLQVGDSIELVGISQVFNNFFICIIMPQKALSF